MQTKSEMINRIAELAKENAELKAENTALKKDIKACNTCEHSTKIYGNEIVELKAELQNFKDMAKKGLDEFKDVGGCWGCGLQLQLNKDMEDIKRLKAESERLKQEWRLDCLKCEYKNTKADVDKYKQTLQEIKAIAERGFNNSQCNCGLKADIEQILQFITKAESEG
jgi:regulator of replication initiation timing